MKESYRTVYIGGEGEITEKKSRFIAAVRLTQTEEEALQFIEETRKKHWSAKHNCYAYVIGENREIIKATDDGEPSGTAGRPILDVLLGADLYNTTIVVTRYFGGILLGTGGLVRAYSQASKAGLDNSILIEKKAGVLINIRTDYNCVGKIRYFLGQKKMPIQKADYAEDVTIQVIVPISDRKQFCNDMTEATNGRISLSEEGTAYYAEVDGNILMGEELKG